MAMRSQFTSVAVKTQSAVDTWGSPTSSDLFPCANVNLRSESITAENPEYLGAIDRPGDFVLGERVSLTLSIPMRPPGGASPPAADAYIPGRFLKAANFTEIVTSAAVPTSPAAVSAGTTTSATLGAAASSSAQAYKGFGLSLSDNGSGYNRQLTAIKDYTSGKIATLPETLSGAPAANYQIPKQLSYHSGATGNPPVLSLSVWYDAVRFDLINMAVSSLRFTFPVSTRNSTEYPMMELTLDGDIYQWADEAAPTVGALGAIPTFKDGDMWIANKALGGSSFSVDMGIQVGYPPNPNKAQGNDAAQLTQTKRTAQITLNHNTKATIDFRALALAQSYHSLWAQYGYTAGNMVGFLIPNGRFTYPNQDVGSEFVSQTIDMLIDDVSRSVNLYFPY
ncbi:hypothetical protein [Sphingobium fluviale]|uniref:Uncharacterized protein n=1 Tax=Sphingobium fluviale TaxID=2506423 RepID=A0A4Q1KHB7_9SPHN|nr:hypothetical protein [Sphingobium fluviale]RXR28957.1 hypothetical protein EQG66_07720 [Sphingobium fluviale]